MSTAARHGADERAGNGRVELVTRPAWRVTLAARAPRIVAGVLAAVVMVAGLRAIVAGPPAPPAAARPAPAPDQAAASFAEAFVRSYLSWDPARPDERERALARFASEGLDAGAGLEIPDGAAQTVSWSAVVGSQPATRRRQLVTVAAVAGQRSWYVAVPVTRDKRGYLAVAGYPALVGPPPVATGERASEEDEVADPQLRAVAQRAVRNYLAGERNNLLADLDPGAVVSLPRERARVLAVEEVTAAGRGRVAVAVQASTAGARFTLRYELSVLRRERWYVRSIETDPRALTAGGGR